MAGKNLPKNVKGLNMAQTVTEKKERKARQKDNRPAETIWAARAFNAVRIMDRQHAKLRKLATARNAIPTEAQLTKLTQHMDEAMTVTLNLLRSRLEKARAGDTGEKPQPSNFLL